MNRVLEYAARHGQRGTVYGTASMMTAGMVLAAPAVLWAGNAGLQYMMRQPRGWLSEFNPQAFMMDLPWVVILGLPVVGMVLGAVGLARRCKRNELVVLGVLVNISGLIAAVGAIWLKG